MSRQDIDSRLDKAYDLVQDFYTIDEIGFAITSGLLRNKELTISALRVAGHVAQPIGLATSLAYGLASNGVVGATKEVGGFYVGFKVTERIFAEGLPAAGQRGPWGVAALAVVSVVAGYAASKGYDNSWGAVADRLKGPHDLSPNPNLISPNRLGQYLSGWNYQEGLPKYDFAPHMLALYRL